MKVWEIFWNTKIQLSFQSSSAAALIRKLSDGKFIEFCGISGPSFWIRANFRWFGQRGVEKKSQKTASFKVTKFLPCHFLLQGCQTCIRCARKNNSLHSENEKISTVLGLKAEIVSKFQKKMTGFEQKRFGSVVRTEIYMSKCFFCEKYISEANI